MKRLFHCELVRPVRRVCEEGSDYIMSDTNIHAFEGKKSLLDVVSLREHLESRESGFEIINEMCVFVEAFVYDF